MKTIEAYLDNVFSGIPDTQEAQHAKHELINNMTDRYDDLIGAGKTENEAVGMVIAEFGNIDELKSELGEHQPQQEPNTHFDDLAFDASIAELFIENRHRAALYIAGGVGLSVLGVLSSLALILRRQELLIPVILAVFFIAIAVALFILGGLLISNTNQDLERIHGGSGSIGWAKQGIQDYQRSFTVGLVCGILLILFSPIPLMLIWRMGMYSFFSVLLILVATALNACGIALIVYVGIIRGSLSTIQNLHHRQQEQATEKLLNATTAGRLLNQVYWPLLVAFFFVTGTLLHAWQINWLVFPLGGIFYTVIRTAIISSEKPK